MADPLLSLYDLLSGATEGELEVRLFDSFNEEANLPQISDFHEAEYTGYQRQRIPDPDAAEETDDGGYSLESTQFTFRVGLGSAVPGTTVLGCYVVMIVDGQEAIANFVVFDEPVRMMQEPDYCQFSIIISTDDFLLE